MNNNIYAYYESIPRTNQNEEFGCANYWKQSWTENKWNPIMLNRSHAQASQLYGKLQQKLVTMMLGLPSCMTAKSQFIAARFTRWCALHAAGGGWMSDYDVLNIDMNHSSAKEIVGKATLSTNKGKAFVIYATKEHCEHAIKKFISSDLIKGNDVVDECDILGIKDFLIAGKSLKHAKPTKTLTKYQVMENIMKCEK